MFVSLVLVGGMWKLCALCLARGNPAFRLFLSSVLSRGCGEEELAGYPIYTCMGLTLIVLFLFL